MCIQRFCSVVYMAALMAVCGHAFAAIEVTFNFDDIHNSNVGHSKMFTADGVPLTVSAWQGTGNSDAPFVYGGAVLQPTFLSHYTNYGIGVEHAVDGNGGGDPYEPLVHQRSVGARPHNMPPEELADLLRTGEVVSRTNDQDTGRTIVQISDGDHLVAGLFERRSSRGFYPDLAAYRLDRLLNLDMVPVTVRREINGRDGTVQFFPPKAVDEARRAARNYGLGASCPLGDQLMAMYAFDSLIYNEGRTRERMLYDTRTWSLVLVGHEQAFTAKRGRPRHLEEAGIEFSDGWREALQSLGDDVLAENLSAVLDKRRLSALRSRRAEILAEIAAAERR